MTQPMRFAPGLLAAHQIEALVAAGHILRATTADEAVPPIQPASLDLRLGARAWRVRASFLPGPSRTVAEVIASHPVHPIDLATARILEPGTVTIVELDEVLRLPPGLSAAANPKSSTGRIDVFVRVIADRATRFDQIEAGYAGPLYAEVSPRTFPIEVRAGSRLAQIRFGGGGARLDDDAHRDLHARTPLVVGAQPVIAGGVALSIDLAGVGPDGLVGYRAKRHTGIIDVDRLDALEVDDFWEPIVLRARRELILDPGEFYILASKEEVRVPADHAAEMMPFDPLVGEFRVHYAGFFDPGFGMDEAGGGGSRAVLEVRSRDVPFVLDHGQIVGRLAYERLSEAAHRLYGAGLGSNYQAQGLKLSKHFRVGDRGGPRT